MTEYTKTLNESLALTESVSGRVIVITEKTLNEPLALTEETAGRVVTVTDKSITESMALTALMEYLKEKHGSLSPEITLTDNLSSINFTKWKRQYEGLTVVHFECTMTDPFQGQDDLVLPMASFQIRMQHRYGDGGWTPDTYDHVTVYVPGLDHAQAISDRPGGQIKIEIVHTYRGNEVLREILAETNYGQIEVNSYQGASSATIEIRGVQRLKVWDLAEGGWMSGEITLENPTYRGTAGGRIEYRFGLIDPGLKAGWYAYVGDDEFHIGEVTLNVSPESISVVAKEAREDR